MFYSLALQFTFSFYTHMCRHIFFPELYEGITDTMAHYPDTLQGYVGSKYFLRPKDVLLSPQYSRQLHKCKLVQCQSTTVLLVKWSNNVPYSHAPSPGQGPRQEQALPCFLFGQRGTFLLPVLVFITLTLLNLQWRWLLKRNRTFLMVMHPQPECYKGCLSFSRQHI